MSLLKTMLYNVNGEPEIGRVITWVAALSAIFSPVVFMGCAMAFQDVKFDPIAWCTAYPGGLAALVASAPSMAAVVWVKAKRLLVNSAVLS